ncbi:MAG: hypothetical protein HY078_03525 [Elusimicrobia bacterium]|nr:hypothetical protein [Elusimicrobiota bacterium]
MPSPQLLRIAVAAVLTSFLRPSPAQAQERKIADYHVRYSHSAPSRTTVYSSGRVVTVTSGRTANSGFSSELIGDILALARESRGKTLSLRQEPCTGGGVTFRTIDAGEPEPGTTVSLTTPCAYASVDPDSERLKKTEKAIADRNAEAVRSLLAD